MFDCRKFYEDHGIDYAEGGDGHKHCRPGWIQIECPRCTGNPGLHLGFAEDSGGFFSCWRCGWMSIEEAIRLLVGVNWSEAKRLKSEYGGRTTTKKRVQRKAKERDIHVKLPMGSREMQEQHRDYLEKRNFDPDELDDVWDLYGTIGIGPYANRIIAPVYYKGKLVSYQGRDITDTSEKKYKACEKENERIHHKHVLYGYDLSYRDVVVVEGITDVWRLGPGAVATFGTKYTHMQVRLLSQFRRIFILFDEEDPAALDQAYKLMTDLSALGRHSEVITTGDSRDPGDYDDEEARYLMRELLLTPFAIGS